MRPQQSFDLAAIGRGFLFGRALLRAVRQPRAWLGSTVTEASQQTSDALPLVLLLSTMGGALISLQTGFQFQGNLPAWVIGSIVSSSLVTEVTPMFVGLGIIGMIGTRVAAELGTMRVTEQIDALELIGRDPIPFLVLPRVLGATLAGPILMALALFASMIAGWLVAIVVTNATTQDFWFGVRYYMRDFPLFFALIKGFAFGSSLIVVASFIGLEATGGSAGVGRTVKQAVVAMLLTMVTVDTIVAPLLKVVTI
jgi:phospholipid/cholesterol/gamma-HCH transport system permease protein